MCKILITGAYGFVGSNLSTFLSKISGCKLFSLDIITNRSNCFVANYSWDNLDSIIWDELETIIHLAGLAHDTKNTLDINRYFEVNVGLTQLIFDRFLKSKAKKFIFFSSVKAVSDSVSGEVLNEDVLPNPQTPYGKSKLEAEKYILNQQLSVEKKIYILRPCMIHGPGNKGNLNLLYKFIKLGIPYPLGAFENKRSFTSIENLNFILEIIIKKDIVPGVYNIADNEPLSTNELIIEIARALCKKVRIWKINKQLIRHLAKLGDYFRLPFNSERLKKLTENYIVSNQKLIAAIGTTMPFSSKEGLLHSVKSFSKS